MRGWREAESECVKDYKLIAGWRKGERKGREGDRA